MSGPGHPAEQAEQAEQAAWVAWIWGAQGAVPPPRLRALGTVPLARGLAAYREHAKALAVRALAARYPLLQAWMGEAAFAGMAWAFARAHPPQQGDLGRWGGALRDFLQAQPRMDAEPLLLAAVDDALHRLASAPDEADPDAAIWQRLAQGDPARLRLRWSRHLRRLPLPATLGDAAALRGLLATGNEPLAAAAQAEAAFLLVWRRGWKPCRAWLADDEAHWLGLQCEPEAACRTLAEAVQAQMLAYPQFDLGASLQRSWAQGWLLGVDETPTPGAA